MLEIITRLESAKGADRIADAMIWEAIELPLCREPDCLPDVFVRLIARVKGGGDDPECPAYTGSVDAAMSLVPRMWGTTLDQYVLSDEGDHTWRVWLRHVTEADSIHKVFGVAPTPALAMCIAALKARAPFQPQF